MATTAEITAIARQLRDLVGPHELVGAKFDSLVEMYAVLALTKGTRVTNEDVHNIWVIWAYRHEPDSPFLVPYRQLPQSVQDEDSPFATAIRQAASSL